MKKNINKAKNNTNNQVRKDKAISSPSLDNKKRKSDANPTPSSPKKPKNNPILILHTTTISQRIISKSEIKIQIQEIDNAIQNSKNITQDYQIQIQILTNLMLSFQNNIPNLEKEKLELEDQLKHHKLQNKQKEVSNKNHPWANL